MNMGERRCAACGKVLVQRPAERTHKFIKRQTCGLSCGATAANLERYRNIERQPFGICCICSGPVRADKAGRFPRSCHKPECRSMMIGRNGSRNEDDPNHHISWPALDPRPIPDYRPHNIKPKDGVVARLTRPDARSYVGSSARWCSELS